MIQEYRDKLNTAEGKIFDFFVEQIRAGEGGYIYTVRGLKEDLHIHHQEEDIKVSKGRAND